MQVEIYIRKGQLQMKLTPEESIEQSLVDTFHQWAAKGLKPTINGNAGYLTVTLDTPANACAQKISS